MTIWPRQGERPETSVEPGLYYYCSEVEKEEKLKMGGS